MWENIRRRLWGKRRGDRARRSIVSEPLEARALFSVNVTLDATQHFQQIDGFGTATYGAASALYATAAFQNLYYQDLGASMIRTGLPAGALEGPGHTLASPVTLGSNLAADIKLFNFTGALGGVGTLIKASLTKKRDSVKVIASLWSPPNWMKGEEVDPNTGQPNGVYPAITDYGNDTSGGSLIDTPANLTQFGRYVAAYVKGFQQTYGVPIYALSIQNELAFHETYDSCVYSPKIYVDALKAVHNAFVQYGITTKIEGPEDVGVGSTTNPWSLWRQFQYINAVRADPVAMKDLNIYSIHGYADDGITAGRSPVMWGQYWNGRPQAQNPTPVGAWWTGIAHDGKPSWMTETSGEPQTFAGAMLVAENAQDALVQGNASAWLYWQTADGGAASQYTLTSGTSEATAKFAAAQQFFRYIRPGSVRIAATPSNPNGVYVSAFAQSAQHTLTSVLINTSATNQTVVISLKGVSVSSFRVDRRTDATHTFANLGPISLQNGKATVSLPAQSILTLQGST